MATIEILGWTENLGFTAGDHAKSELRKRIRRGLNAPPGEIKRLLRQIHAKQRISVQDVRDEAVYELTQILQSTGADLRVPVRCGNARELFRRCPKRSRRVGKIPNVEGS